MGVFFGPKMSLWCFYGLKFSMILDYHVHGDICVKCCRQEKMYSSVGSDPRNGFSGGALLLGRQIEVSYLVQEPRRKTFYFNGNLVFCVFCANKWMLVYI